MNRRVDLSNEMTLTSIEELNLSRRAKNALIRRDINTVGQVIELGYWGIVGLSQVGEKLADEIVNTLAEYCQVQLEVLKQSIVTVQLHLEVTPDEKPNLIRLIVPLTKALLDSYNDQRGFKFLKYYYGLNGNETYILQDIGDAEGLSRERIRQINKQNIQRLNLVLFGKKGAEDRIVSKHLVSEAIDLYKFLNNQEGILSEREILEIVKERYGQAVDVKELNNLKFLLNVFGFKELAQRRSGYTGSEVKAWQIDGSLEAEKIWQALGNLYQVLDSAVVPLSDFELKMQVIRRRKKKLEDVHIVNALRICPDIEVVNSNSYQLKFERLSSLADQGYRILWEAGKPLHYREILREINHRLVRAGFPASGYSRSLINQMVNDTKFEPIGRSGQWKLSEWERVHTQTTVDLMKEYLHLKKTSAKINEIHDYVVSKRPNIPKQSVITYLHQKDDFVRVSPSQYALAVWGDKPAPKKSNTHIKDRLAPVIKNVMKEMPGQTMPLNELVQLLQDHTGILPRNIYNWLNRSTLIQIEPKSGHNRNKIVKYVEDKSKENVLLQKKTIMKTVQEEIEKYLKEQSNKKALVANVGAHVMKVTGCRKQTFYNYLSRMENVKKESVSGKLYCYLVEDGDTKNDRMVFLQLSQVADEYLRENITRAVGLLNVNTVDVGLFQLGKIFENELKMFLIVAQQEGTFLVVKNDLARLVNMIDCVVREGIIEKKTQLTFLREERNERAHGAIPQTHEREALMRYAPFLAGLYIDHIIIFHQERLKIQR